LPPQKKQRTNLPFLEGQVLKGKGPSFCNGGPKEILNLEKKRGGHVIREGKGEGRSQVKKETRKSVTLYRKKKKKGDVGVGGGGGGVLHLPWGADQIE